MGYADEDTEGNKDADAKVETEGQMEGVDE